MGIEGNIATRSEAGLILCSIQSFSFLCFLSFWGTVLKEINDTQEYMQKINGTQEYMQEINDTQEYIQEINDTQECMQETNDTRVYAGNQ